MVVVVVIYMEMVLLVVVVEVDTMVEVFFSEKIFKGVIGVVVLWRSLINTKTI